MRLFWTLNPLPYVIRESWREIWDSGREGGHVVMEAEIGVMPPWLSDSVGWSIILYITRL